MLSPILVNPAFTGNDGALSIGLVSRLQLLGLESSNPMSNTIFAHTPLKNKNLALGTIISYDKFGPQNTFNGKLLASGKFKISKFKIGIGGSLDYTNNRIIFDEKNQISFESASNDPVYANNNSTNSLNFGLGINIQYKFMYIGAVAPAIKINTSNESVLQKNYFYSPVQVFGGLNYRIVEAILLKPSFLIRTLKSSGLQFDINLLANLFDKFTTGVSYKNNSGIAGLFMVQISPQIAISYTYEHITTNQKVGSMGNHELQLKYIFKYYINDLNVKKFK